ncbi:hypothetical protein BDK51DRAFT_31536 [Blyttiomyces helicus]|uniref:Longin domain-containing protein n=1 Tax=Blyttiomyces helicus TaxID=388810 RepID=A0A4P9WPB9_9FUNG|nr:hypothetical protein BDK51DRAFT_31536 [Blyttiomyces helicus]|eukprot:RKO93578.1 hypothetical protein BDK51DRAFT_31536 [Blyttiomyces helicus]
MPIVYGLISRGAIVLAEHATTTGNFTTVTQHILEKIPEGDSKMTYVYDRYLFHYIQRNNIIYLCLADDTFGRRIPFTFLEDMSRRFEGLYGERAQTAIAYGLNEYSKTIAEQMDRHVAEYDIENSSVLGGVSLRVKRGMQFLFLSPFLLKLTHGDFPALPPHSEKALKRIEQTARPLSAVLHPTSNSSAQFLMTSTTAQKLKLYNCETLMCRRTVLAPCYGGNIRGLEVVPGGGCDRYLAFRTDDKVVGLIKLPLDGNPYRTMGLIAHPGSISNLVATFDGSHILTAGGPDGVVNMWSLTPGPFDAQIVLGGTGIEPFLNMLDPSGAGETGAFYREMEDYFYYAQLRSQGEDATKNRQIEETVNLSEVPSIMQAMGYYPSAQEIDDMINEVKYSGWNDGDGVLANSMTFEDLIKSKELTEPDILSALAHAARLDPGNPPARGPAPPPLLSTSEVPRAGLVSLLQQYGETFSASDFDDAFRSLLSTEAPPFDGKLPERFRAGDFIETVLGLVGAAPPAVETSRDGKELKGVMGEIALSADSSRSSSARTQAVAGRG